MTHSSPLHTTHYILSSSALSSRIESIEYLQDAIWMRLGGANDAPSRKRDWLDEMMDEEGSLEASMEALNDASSLPASSPWHRLFHHRMISAKTRTPSTDHATLSSNTPVPLPGLSHILPFRVTHEAINESNLVMLTYASEYMPDDILSLRHHSSPLSWRETTILLAQTLRALQHAGTPHGAITPQSLRVSRNHATSRMNVYITNWGRFDWDYRIEDATQFYIQYSATVANVTEDAMEDAMQYGEESLTGTPPEQTIVAKLNDCSKFVNMYRVAAIFYVLFTGDEFCIREALQEDWDGTVQRMREALTSNNVDEGIQSLLLCMMHPENNFHYDAFICYIQYRIVRDLFNSIQFVVNARSEAREIAERVRHLEETHAPITRRNAQISDFFILQHADVLVDYAMEEMMEFVEGEAFQEQCLLECMRRQDFSMEAAQHIAIISRNMRNRAEFLQRVQKELAQQLLHGVATEAFKSLPFLIATELHSHADTHQMEAMVREMEAQDALRVQWNAEQGTERRFDTSFQVLSKSLWHKYFDPDAILSGAVHHSELGSVSRSMSQFYSRINEGKSMSLVATEGSVSLSMHSNSGATYQINTDLAGACILDLFNADEADFSEQEMSKLTGLRGNVLHSRIEALLECGLLSRDQDARYGLNTAFESRQRKVDVTVR